MAILKQKDKLTNLKTDEHTAGPMQAEHRTIETDDGNSVFLDRRSANGDRRVNAYDPNYTGLYRRYSIERRDTDHAEGMVVNEDLDENEISIIEKMVKLLDE